MTAGAERTTGIDRWSKRRFQNAAYWIGIKVKQIGVQGLKCIAILQSLMTLTGNLHRLLTG
jgi:hypothetical protein